MKPAILVFYGKNPEPAKALALSLRTGINIVVVREAIRYMGEEREVCERVLVMPDVTPICRQELDRLFGDKVELFSGPIEEVLPTPVVTEVTPEFGDISERPRKRSSAHRRSNSIQEIR